MQSCPTYYCAETFCCLCRDMAKRIWVLSFVLAPYTHLLAQTTHIPQSKKLIDRIIPPLLERYPIHAHMGHTGNSALPEEASAHKAHLCAQCQAAAQQRSSAAHSKRGLSGKGGPKQAAPTELQADSSAASLLQPHAADMADASGFTLPGMLCMLTRPTAFGMHTMVRSSFMHRTVRSKVCMRRKVAYGSCA